MSRETPLLTEEAIAGWSERNETSVRLAGQAFFRRFVFAFAVPINQELSHILGGRKIDLNTPNSLSEYFRQEVYVAT